MHDLADLPQRLLDEIEHFFDVYKMLEPEKKSTTGGYEGRDAAYAEIEASRLRYQPEIGGNPDKRRRPRYRALASRHSLRRNRSVTNRPYGAQMTDVVLVRWPEETERLERLRAAGAPRLLLVGEDLAAPEPVDPLEDWIRLPAAEDDLRVRVSTLASRAGRSRGRTDRRRRRPAPLPGPVGHVVAGRAGARGGADRPVQRGGRA